MAVDGGGKGGDGGGCGSKGGGGLVVIFCRDGGVGRGGGVCVGVGYGRYCVCEMVVMVIASAAA
jgi:hypothetical protein